MTASIDVEIDFTKCLCIYLFPFYHCWPLRSITCIEGHTNFKKFYLWKIFRQKDPHPFLWNESVRFTTGSSYYILLTTGENWIFTWKIWSNEWRVPKVSTPSMLLFNSCIVSIVTTNSSGVVWRHGSHVSRESVVEV